MREQAKIYSEKHVGMREQAKTYGLFSRRRKQAHFGDSKWNSRRGLAQQAGQRSRLANSEERKFKIEFRRSLIWCAEGVSHCVPLFYLSIEMDKTIANN